MQVGLVSRCLNTRHVRGMGRYLQEVMLNTPTHAGLEWHLLADNPNEMLQAPDGVKAQAHLFSFRGDRFNLWEQMALPYRASKLGLDVLHCTEGSGCVWQPVPTVITLHDTIAWHDNDGRLYTRWYWNKAIPTALRRASAVITISEHSKRDILVAWPDLEPKVHVIPHGIGQEYLQPNFEAKPSAIEGNLRGKPYLVYLGGPVARKRFAWALEVLRNLDDPDVQLVACGFAEQTHPKILSEVPADLSSRVYLCPFLNNIELLSLYRNCEAVLYPTLYEGFGFPAIEAQAAGAPAVFSPVSSLAELVGPLAFTPGANDLADWVAAVHRARALGAKRAALAGQARAWAEQAFSWMRSSQAHLAVYKQVVR